MREKVAATSVETVKVAPGFRVVADTVLIVGRVARLPSALNRSAVRKDDISFSVSLTHGEKWLILTGRTIDLCCKVVLLATSPAKSASTAQNRSIRQQEADAVVVARLSNRSNDRPAQGRGVKELRRQRRRCVGKGDRIRLTTKDERLAVRKHHGIGE